MIRLRPYQSELEHDIYDVWRERPRANITAVAATGSGKTVLFSKILHDHRGACVAIAHRQELIAQISLALARNGVRHRLIGAKELTRTCVSLHMLEIGQSFFDPSALCAVAGVDTLIRMKDDSWMKQVTLIVLDECHHLLRNNKWGKAAAMFPNARCLGVTATPMRADGQGLGRHADGIMDALVLAPNMRDLIKMGYLNDYRVFAPPSDLDLDNVPISAGGDFSPEPLRKAVHASHIVGDVVQHYGRLAQGKLGVTFAVDVEAATEIAASFNAAGIPAAVVHAETPAWDRVNLLRRFRNREILQLCNVDLFSEGFDLPAIEVVSMARPTHSFPLFAQQFGRACRVMVSENYLQNWDMYSDAERCDIIARSSKPRALIIDHVGNIHRHGLPDAVRTYTLDRRATRSRVQNIIPIRTCAKCGSAYERSEIACPYCQYRQLPTERSTPAQVDGDLHELDPAVLARMRGEIEAGPNIQTWMSPEIVRGITGHWHQKNAAQRELREAIAQWGGYQTQSTDTDELRKAQKRFFLIFGVDVLTAQTLARKEAEELTARVRSSM